MAFTTAPWSRPVISSSIPPSSSSFPTRPPLPSSSVPFGLGSKLIKLPTQLNQWKKSQTYAELMVFLYCLHHSVLGKAYPTDSIESSITYFTHEIPCSPSILDLTNFLLELQSLIDKFPPQQQSQRFGNKSYRLWHEEAMKQWKHFLRYQWVNKYWNKNGKLKQLYDESKEIQANQSINQLESPSDPLLDGLVDELFSHLIESFGNSSRLDYGSGHETNFIFFLCLANKCGLFREEQTSFYSLVVLVFRAYISLMHQLQTVYWLEPAGSKGSWGLDDYQFIVFLLGSAQLIDQRENSTVPLPLQSPSSILNSTLVKAQAPHYLYYEAIEFIQQMKTGAFHEHSALLYSISQCESWRKVNTGLWRMYEEEVLNKFPIVQHIHFGQIFTLEEFHPEKSQLGVDWKAIGLEWRMGPNGCWAISAAAGKRKADIKPPVPVFQNDPTQSPA
jgi:serine/threonine-protein phosphatase 2A activator